MARARNSSDRIRVAVGVAARDASDFARGLVGDLGTEVSARDRIRSARHLRVLSFAVLQRTVILCRAEGASWDEIADGLALTVDEARSLYEATSNDWIAGRVPGGVPEAVLTDLGLGPLEDDELGDTAATLDAWFERSRDPWDTSAPNPVSRAIGPRAPK